MPPARPSSLSPTDSLYVYALCAFESNLTPLVLFVVVLITVGIAREVAAALSNPFGDDDVDFPVSARRGPGCRHLTRTRAHVDPPTCTLPRPYVHDQSSTRVDEGRLNHQAACSMCHAVPSATA